MEEKWKQHVRKVKSENKTELSEPSFSVIKPLLFFYHEQLRLLSIKHKEETDIYAFEGNIYTYNGVDTYESIGVTDNLIKMENLYNMAQKISGNILEIGFNCGNSTLIFLLANPNVKIYALDICVHSYVKPCVEYLNSIFNNRIILTPGSSIDTFPTLDEKLRDDITLYHIDGSHVKDTVQKDMKNCYDFALDGTILILDDTNEPQILSEYENYLKDSKLHDVPITTKGRFLHRIGVYRK